MLFKESDIMYYKSQNICSLIEIFCGKKIDLSNYKYDEGENISNCQNFKVNKLLDIGLTKLQAKRIIAACELGLRLASRDKQKTTKLSDSQQVYNSLKPYFHDLEVEQFRIILLNRNNNIIGNEMISLGGVTGTVVDPKVIFKKALIGNATSIILAHNHPSGNLKPSTADLSITKQIKEAGKVLDITVLDHIIVSCSGYYSFADEGEM